MSKVQSWKRKIARELDDLRQGNEGALSPSLVLEWARAHPKSALHGSFQWDDDKAAQEYRLWQARQIIQEYEVVTISSPKRKPVEVKMVSVPSERRGKKGSYISRDVVMERPDYRKSVLEEQVKKLKTMRETFGEMLPELNPVWEAIDKIAI